MENSTSYRNKLILTLGVFMLLFGCRKPVDDVIPTLEPYNLKIPTGFPIPEFAEDNPLTVEGIKLGKKLFFDKRLSRDGSLSCASCHLVGLGFTDNLAVSIGVDGAVGSRNSPTLANTVYQDRYFYDGGVPTLELQVLAPIHNKQEMDFNILDLVDLLNEDEELVALSKKVYQRDVIDPWVITRAISNYERIMISGNSRYDQYYYQGNTNVMTAQEIEGMNLFFSDELKCAECHSGFNFTNNDYANIGLYEVYEDFGRERISFDSTDIGKFKVPTLRNIELTSPYMHDGSIETLEEVIDFLNTGGMEHANKSEFIVPLNLSSTQKTNLIVFLKTLTDTEFINNPIFQEE